MNRDSIEEKIYDFEGVFADAFQAVMDSIDITGFSTGKDPEFQLPMPRAEAWVEIGAATGQLAALAVGQSVPGLLNSPEIAFAGVTTLTVITLPSKEIHAAYISRIRRTCRSMCNRVNGLAPDAGGTVYHWLQSFSAGQCTYDRDSSKGRFVTNLAYNFRFSINKNAFADLDA